MVTEDYRLACRRYFWGGDGARGADMARAGLKDGEHPVHHSDRGCQYCSHDYIAALRKTGMPVSMTEEAHCYKNAQAERLNGILKQEYGPGDFQNEGRGAAHDTGGGLPVQHPAVPCRARLHDTREAAQPAGDG